MTAIFQSLTQDIVVHAPLPTPPATIHAPRLGGQDSAARHWSHQPPSRSPSQQPSPAPPPTANQQSTAQRARRERERRVREVGARSSPAPPPEANQRSIGQRRRRERERRARDTGTRLSQPPSRSPSLAPPPAANQRTIAQRERRERERRARGVEAAAAAAPLGGQRADNGNDLNLPPARRPYQEPATQNDLGRMDVPCPHCGALHWIEERLAQSSPTSPNFGSCCDHGQVQLDAVEDPPYALQQLFLGLTAQGREFLENIRQYNTAFAFTSLGVKQDHAVNRGVGPYVFRIHGELCHRAGSLLPEPGQSPSYAQLYIHDPRAASRYRASRNGNVREDTLQLLENTLRASHFYARYYQHAYGILRDQDDAPDLAIRLQCKQNQDPWRYNLPTVDEVAAILPGDVS